MMTVSASAQMMRAEDLKKYAVGRYGDKWTEAARNLGKEISWIKTTRLLIFRL